MPFRTYEPATDHLDALLSARPDTLPEEYQHSYCSLSVDREIAKAERRGGRMSKREKRAIHALLRGHA